MTKFKVVRNSDTPPVSLSAGRLLEMVVYKSNPVAVLFLIFAMAGCDQTQKNNSGQEVFSPSSELNEFIERVKGDLVFVEGGDFLMGDYGVQFGPEKLPYDRELHSKPLHEVELSNYSIGKFKITNAEFQFYLKARGMTLRGEGMVMKNKWDAINSLPNIPAHLDWFEAENYCKWLSTQSGEPFALPTEAQWEYAARSRGQFLMVATEDGTYKMDRTPSTETDGPRGINISTWWDRAAFAKDRGWETEGLTPLPVDRFPPNPLGLYAMSDNGQEWVKDWYDPNYYEYSPKNDPQGPDSPIYKDRLGRGLKVVRGQSYPNPAWGGGVNVYRDKAEPHGYALNTDLVVLIAKTARCVVNSPEPVK